MTGETEAAEAIFGDRRAAPEGPNPMRAAHATRPAPTKAPWIHTIQGGEIGFGAVRALKAPTATAPRPAARSNKRRSPTASLRLAQRAGSARHGVIL